MTGIEALEELKKGKAVRGINWYPEFYVYLNENGEIVDDTGHAGTLPASSFLNDDWEIYDKKKTGTRMIQVIENKIEQISNEILELQNQIIFKRSTLHKEEKKLNKYRGVGNGNK